MLQKIKEHSLLAAIIGAVGVVAVIAFAIIICTVSNNGGTSKIEYSDGEHSAIITLGEDDTSNPDSEEYGLGEAGEDVEVDGIPTVESVDAQGPVVDASTSDDLSIIDDGEEHGLGAYIYAPVESASAFKNYTLGQCLNTDGAYGAQCWDLADVFWQNYAGRRAQTCGTGAAKGMIQDGCYQKNAGNDFEMVWNAKGLQAGDWVIFTSGTYGHVGMALGGYNNGYVTLLGQNQGGKACEGGGAATNIINISTKYFAGAFRPKDYIVPPAPEPTPTPEPSGSDTYVVTKGDTLGSIAIKMGWWKKGDGALFGNNGFTEKLAKKNGITNRGLIYPGQTIRAL